MCDKDIAVRAEDTRAVAPVTDKTLTDYLQAFGLANQLSKQETSQFVEIAKAYSLNPFKREIYCLPYGHGESRRLSIIVGYEVYLKRADQNPAFDGYTTEFGTENGVLTCTCTVYRKDRKYPTSQTVSLKEYNTGKSLWLSKPRAMLEKVAIATAFRRAFPNDFGGMPYTKEELPEDMTEPRDVTPQPEPISEPAPAPEPQQEITKPTQEQVEKLNALKTAFTADELSKFKVQYRGDIPAMIKAMSEARLKKFDEGTLRKGTEAPGEPEAHAWASPEVKARLEGGNASGEQFQDDSAELYSDAKQPEVF